MEAVFCHWGERLLPISHEKGTTMRRYKMPNY